MKSVRNVYQNLLDIDRIKEIIILAAKGKKKRKEVIDTLNDIDNYSETPKIIVPPSS